mgnify:CR=1 FL=1
MNVGSQPSVAVWLGFADGDYIAARSLLRRSLIVQGAIFANTAVEKYLKTVLLVEGKQIPITHDVPELYEKFMEGRTRRP